MQKTRTHKARRFLLCIPVLLLSVAIAQAAQEAAATAKTSVKTAVIAKKSNLVPLKIKLPRALLVGTQKNVKTPNLEKRTGPRPVFLVPKGVKSLALKKTVSGSDEFPIIGEMENITDGDKEGGEGSFVEFGPGMQYVQIDLEETQEIWAVVFWHYYSNNRIYNDVIVQTSDDPDFITNVRTLFNNDHDNSSGLGSGKDKDYLETYRGKLVPGKGVRDRYLRLYSNGNTSNELNHYIEIEVYGFKASERGAVQKTSAETLDEPLWKVGLKPTGEIF